RHRSPVKALFGCFEMTASMAATPESLARSLSFLQIDLIDPEFHKWMLVNAEATEAGYRALLRDCIRAGELARCNTEMLARLIQATLHGSMVSWAVFQKGTRPSGCGGIWRLCSGLTAPRSAEFGGLRL